MELQNKVLDAFNGKVVRKDLAFQVKGNLPVPTYVLEYLLGQYCATDDPALIEEGINRVKDIIRNNYINRAEAEEVKGKIREQGSYRVIDKITAILNDKKDFYEASFANLGLQHIPIGSDFVVNNPKLLSGNGVWSIVKLNYLSGDDIPVRWEIEMLKPIQISFVDVDDYTSLRDKFTTEEWLDFMIHTEGLNPDNLNRREKFIVLSRLLPHVENNFNFMELGPKGTGKSHVFQELSPYGVLVSGGDVTSARLFSKISGNKEIMGLVGYWDVVAWDEFEQQPGKQVDPTMIDTMQNYLANKSFNRGKATHEASASMVFVGNTKHTVPYMLKNSHLFESIPHQFLKGAFLDRIHLYNPGWEMKMLKKSSFSAGFGLITDYIAAVLHELRNRDFSADMAKIVKFDGSLSERDHLAIRKTFSGMMKLLYPNGKCTEAEALEIIDFAAEGRKRVKEQLYIIDDTFKEEPAKFEYQVLRTGNTVAVQTLEEMNFEGQFLHNPTSQSSADNNNAVSNLEVVPEAPSAKGELISSIKNVRLNQTGISYDTLFGPYLKTARHITVVDPFIRLPYQVGNFVEFVQCARQNCEAPEELVIHLSTQNDDEKVPEMIDIFDDIKDDLAAHNIEFSYDFEADHDRYIDLDNGWTITLGRGLDIFEKVGRFSLDSMNQSERRCKEFNVTYNKKD
jgi:ATP-dependent Lon protease